MYVIILINLEMTTQYWKTTAMKATWQSTIASTAMPLILEWNPTDSNFTT